MKKSVKMALATTSLAVAGTLFLVGSSFAERGFGPLGLGPMDGPGNQILKTVDVNGDGKLSQEEIDTAVNDRFAKFDADANGNLSLTEFEALWADITKPMAVRAFQFLDPDGDAALSKAEIDERFGGIVAEFDRNDDGVLSRADHRGPPHGPRHGPRGWRDWMPGHHAGPGPDGPAGGPDGGPDGEGPGGPGPDDAPAQ